MCEKCGHKNFYHLPTGRCRFPKPRADGTPEQLDIDAIDESKLCGCEGDAALTKIGPEKMRESWDAYMKAEYG